MTRGRSDVRVALVALLLTRACAMDPCADLTFVNRNPVTNQGGVDGRAVLTGELFQLGDFDDCVDRQQATYCLSQVHLHPTNTSTLLAAYIQEHGRWWTHYRRNRLRWGVCAPRQCTDTGRLAHSLDEALVDAGGELGVVATVELRPEDCHTASDTTAFSTDLALLGILLLIVILLLTGSLFDLLQDYIFTNSKKSKRKYGNAARVLLCFSVPANITRLHSECSDQSLAAIQGIRFLVMFGVIAGHCLYINLQGAVTNVAFIEQRYHEWLSMLFANGHLIVSGFFVVSGFLRAYLFLYEAAREGRVSAWMVLRGLLLRYLRLTPTLGMVVLLAATWLYHTGSGPLWHHFLGRVRDNCRDHWWTNMLYINNYVHSDRPCLDHTWYLGVDSQLFVVSAVPLVLVWRWSRLTTPILAVCLAACVLLSFLHTYANRLRATLLTAPTILQNLAADDTFLLGYISLQSNAVSYFMGVTFGVVYYQLRDTKIHKMWVVKWWLLLVPLLFGPVLSAYHLYQPGYQYHRLLESCYAALYKLPFTYAIASVVVLFASGHGWIANDILSSKLCIVLGRLTYATYLVHFLWQYVEAGTRRQPFYLNGFQLTRACFLDLMFSYIWGFFLCICVEMPTSALVKHAVQKRRKETEQQTSSDGASGPEPGAEAEARHEHSVPPTARSEDQANQTLQQSG